jgi:hypothetical protein
MALFRPLKAVARVRIPSGLPGKTAADQAWYHQPASISSDRPSGTREGRSNSRRCCLRHSSTSADFACPTWARAPADLCCREVGPRLGPQGPLAPCNSAPRRSSVITGRRGYRHVGDRQARAIGLRTRRRLHFPAWRVTNHAGSPSGNVIRCTGACSASRAYTFTRSPGRVAANGSPCAVASWLSSWCASHALVISSDRPVGTGTAQRTTALPAGDRIPRCWSRFRMSRADRRCHGMCEAEGRTHRR